MKGKNKSLIWMFSTLVAWTFVLSLSAQGDDLYYDPSSDSKTMTIPQNNYEESDNSTPSYSDDQSYYEEDDYAYEYSSRIRRFHNPTCSSADFYDPMFIDLYHYDPYYLPGASIYSYGYNDYWRWRQWQAARMWNSWYPPYYGPSYGATWTPWGWSITITSGGYGPWYNPFVWNNYYYDPYWTWNGHNPYYYDNCMPSNSYFFYNNHNYYGNNYPGGYNGGYQPQTYVGPRRGGTTIGTGDSGGGGNDGRNYTRLTSNTGSNGRLLVMDDKTKSVDVSTNARTSTRAVVEKQKEMARKEVERNVPSAVNRKPDNTVKNPSTPQGRSQEAEKTRPVPETRPSRQSGGEVSPTRPSGGNENVRPSRPSSVDRPSRPSGGSTPETRPSRSSGDSGSGKTWDTGSPSRSSSGSNNSGSSGSGSKSSSGSSSGKSSGGGGSRGRN